MARCYKPSRVPEHQCPRCGSMDVRKIALSTFHDEIVCRKCGRKIK